MCQLKHRIRRQCPSHRTPPVKQFAQVTAHDILLGARGVYEALCAPASQWIGGFEIASATVPARQISGDFVTSFKANGSWFVALGDLMGKGLAAAMWLTHVLDLLHRACENGKDLPQIMHSLNLEMHRSRVGVPLTSLFLMQLEPNRSRLSYSCGGCPPAFLLRNGGAVLKLERGGPILGALEDAKYSSATIELCPSETLLVASDGIIEVHHPGSDFELRPERVAHHLHYTAGESAATIVQSLLTRVKQSSPIIADDLTVLAVQRVA